MKAIILSVASEYDTVSTIWHNLFHLHVTEPHYQRQLEYLS